MVWEVGVMWLAGLFPAQTALRDFERHRRGKMPQWLRTLAVVLWPLPGLLLLPVWVVMSMKGD